MTFSRWWLFLIVWFSSSVSAEPAKSSEFLQSRAVQGEPCLQVKGSATSKDVTQAFARKMAIRDALKQASMKNNLSVKTDQSVENYQLKLDSARFTSASKIKSFKVVKEGFEDPEDRYGQTKKGALNYEVVLEVCLTEERGVCTNLPGNQYQPRLVVAPVVVTKTNQANDIFNLLNGYQLELDRRIRNQGYRNYELVKEVIDIQPNVQVSPNLDSEQLAAYRDSTGAQYVLLTVVRSLAAHVEKDGWGGIKNNIKSFYNHDVEPSSRNIEADWYILDLMNKKLVHQSRGGFNLEGDVYVGRDKPFGTSGFFSTDTGKAFHALLEKQVSDTIDYLHCKPFQTEIIDARNGEYVLYLSEDSGARVGDDLAVYHRTGMPVRFNGIEIGSDYLPGAFLKIKRIQPRFAIAEITAKKGSVQVGDIVKTW